MLRIDIDGARLTIVRFRDGSFNFNLPRAATRPPPQRPNPVPLRFALRVRNLQIELREPSAYDASAKDLRVGSVAIEASVDTGAVTQYRARGSFEERRLEPFTVGGRIDAVAGYAMHHAQAPRFPMRALANYLADTPAVRILAGEGRNFDARLYALGVVPNATPSYHVSLRLDVNGGRLGINALAAPIENLRARLEVIDNAFFVRGAHATLAGIHLRIDGGAYDFTGALTGGAKLRLASREPAISPRYGKRLRSRADSRFPERRDLACSCTGRSTTR